MFGKEDNPIAATGTSSNYKVQKSKTSNVHFTTSNKLINCLTGSQHASEGMEGQRTAI